MDGHPPWLHGGATPLEWTLDGAARLVLAPAGEGMARLWAWGLTTLSCE